MTTLAEQSFVRVKTWLAERMPERFQIATAAGVDEKTIRLSAADDWDPKISTLRKLEAVIPASKKTRKAAA